MKDRMFVELHEDWSQLFQRCNWYTFRFADVQFEWDKHMGGIEASVILLGLGFRWRWNFAETEATKRIGKAVQDIENGTADLMPIKDYLDEQGEKGRLVHKRCNL